MQRNALSTMHSVACRHSSPRDAANFPATLLILLCHLYQLFSEQGDDCKNKARLYFSSVQNRRRLAAEVAFQSAVRPLRHRSLVVSLRLRRPEQNRLSRRGFGSMIGIFSSVLLICFASSKTAFLKKVPECLLEKIESFDQKYELFF
jgi:hypothetical protein